MPQRHPHIDPDSPKESNHQRGVRHFQEQRFEESALALSAAIAQNETSEAWNDLAAAELSAGQSKAERGFRRALAMDPDNHEAAGNLGALLAHMGKHADAIPFLKTAIAGNNAGELGSLTRLFNFCRSRTSSYTPLLPHREAFRDVTGESVNHLRNDNAGQPRPFDGSDSALASLKEQVASLDWYHQIDLGYGIVTPGCHLSGQDARLSQFPLRLDGLTVLDVNAWDGFFSFESERRGARRVLAMDGFVWRGQCPRASKKGFDLARWALHSKVEDLVAGLGDISPATLGTFDVVILDALYGLPNPLALFHRAFQLTKGLLILSTFLDVTELPRPAAAFYPHVEFSEGASNWWGPNASAVIEMLRAAGFRKVTRIVANQPCSGALDETHETTAAVFHAER